MLEGTLFGFYIYANAVEQIKKDYLHSQADLGTIIEALKNLKKSLGKESFRKNDSMNSKKGL